MFAFFVNYLEPLACLFYLAAVLLNYTQSRQIRLLLLALFYFVSSVLFTIGSFLVKEKVSNIWTYDLVAFFAAVCIGVYFYFLLNTRAKKRTVVVLVSTYLLYVLTRQLTLQGPRLFDSIGYALLSASVVTYVFMYFHQVLKNVTELNILREFNFWLASGYIIYFAGSFIIFVTYFYLTKQLMESDTVLNAPSVRADTHLLTALWGLHNVLLFVGAISLLLSSLWVNYRRKSTSLSSPHFSSY